MLLAYFDALAENANVGGDIQIARARCAPAAQPPVSLAGRSTSCDRSARAGSAEAHGGRRRRRSSSTRRRRASAAARAREHRPTRRWHCSAFVRRLRATRARGAARRTTRPTCSAGCARARVCGGRAHQLRFDRRAAGTRRRARSSHDAARVPGCAHPGGAVHRPRAARERRARGAARRRRRRERAVGQRRLAAARSRCCGCCSWRWARRAAGVAPRRPRRTGLGRVGRAARRRAPRRRRCSVRACDRRAAERGRRSYTRHQD